MTYERFLEIQKQYEEQMSNCEQILNKAKKSECGLTLDSEKTDEWRRAKNTFGIIFNAYRKLNGDNKDYVKRSGIERRNERLKKANCHE
jgi:hypothetical protein